MGRTRARQKEEVQNIILFVKIKKKMAKTLSIVHLLSLQVALPSVSERQRFAKKFRKLFGQVGQQVELALEVYPLRDKRGQA